MVLSIKSAISCIIKLCVCVCIWFYSYTVCMCLLLCISFQTLGSTHVWPPAPAVKHHGALSCKSKVQDDTMISCCYVQKKTLLFQLYLSFCLLLSIHSESGGVLVTKNHDENELPGPPSKPQVTDVTKNSVSLSWQPGMVGASPVSSFVIEAFRFVVAVTSIRCTL